MDCILELLKGLAAQCINIPLDISPHILNKIKIRGVGRPVWQHPGIGWLLLTPASHHTSSIPMGWIIVLLQSPTTDPFGTEQALPFRQEGLLQQMSILTCTNACGCLALLICKGALVLAAASNFMQFGNSKLGYPSIDIEALRVIWLVSLVPLWFYLDHVSAICKVSH